MSHSLRVISSITKLTSPGIRRHATKLTSAADLSTSSSSKPPPVSKPTDKKPSSSKGCDPTLVPTLTTVSAVKEESHVVEKGDSYKAGETYFSFSNYSFYDFEQELQKHRAPQPKAHPKEKYYCNETKQESMTDQEPRRLLPDPWGYLMEWPQEAEVRVVKSEGTKRKETVVKRDRKKEYYPIVETPYNVQRDPKTDPYYKARIPL